MPTNPYNIILLLKNKFPSTCSSGTTVEEKRLAYHLSSIIEQAINSDFVVDEQLVFDEGEIHAHDYWPEAEFSDDDEGSDGEVMMKMNRQPKVV